MCTAKGSDVRPGVPLVSLGLRCFCVAGVGQCALPRALASLWRPSGVPWAPLLLRGRRGTMCTAKGSNVRPGVPLVSLGLRRFCVAGVGQCALTRGRMYALLFLILLPSSYSSSRPPIHSNTSLTHHSHTQSLSHNHAHSLSQHFTHTPHHAPHTLTHTVTHTHTHITHTHTLTTSLITHSPTHTHTLMDGWIDR